MSDDKETAPALWRQVRSEASVKRHMRTAKARQRALTALAQQYPDQFAALFFAEKTKEGLV